MKNNPAIIEPSIMIKKNTDMIFNTNLFICATSRIIINENV